MRRSPWIGVILVALLLLVTPVMGCNCAAKRVIDQAYVTLKGLNVANEINRRAGEGYDVREARAKWLQALGAYNEGDYTTTDRLLDEASSLLKGLEKVAERVYYQSNDGITVSGLLFLPSQGDGPWPIIIVNHPGFGTAADFSDVALMIRDRGYLVFNPDYRGSGESEGHHELAKGEVDDVICAIDYLKSRGLVEDDRIGMYGQSHGAAISMLAAERDGRIKAVVEEAGFCDAVGLYENVAHSSDAGLRQLLNDALPMIGGTPQEVPQEYAVRSAINYVDSITAPILLIHGEKDPLIPAEQAYRMYDALKARGKTTELKIYPQEAHCVNDPVGRMEVWQLMFEWFERYV